MKARKTSGRIDVKLGQQAVAEAAAAYRSVWEFACKHDGIDPAKYLTPFADFTLASIMFNHNSPLLKLRDVILNGCAAQGIVFNIKF